MTGFLLMFRVESSYHGDMARALVKHVRTFWDRFTSALTLYDLFAIAVVYMCFGHYAENLTDSLWLRVGDRILVPVFLIPVGYNVSRRLDVRLAGGAALVAALRLFMFHHWLPALPVGGVTILVTIVAARIAIDPLMNFALKSRWHFWGLNLVFATAAPFTHSHVAEYGTLGLMLAMAGWLSRSRAEIPKGLVDLREYFMLLFVYYIAFNQSLYGFSLVQALVMAAGTAPVFALLYDLRRLLLNARRRKTNDAVSRVVRFTGANSLEIYTIHMIVYYAVFYYALGTAL